MATGSKTDSQRSRANAVPSIWQIGEIEKGLAEADRKDFATENEVKRILRKWTSG